MSNTSFYVKLIYFPKPFADPVKTCFSVKSDVVTVEDFKNVVKDVLKLDKEEIVLKRKSKREQGLVDLETAADYSTLQRSLRVKKYIKLVAIDKRIVNDLDLYSENVTKFFGFFSSKEKDEKDEKDKDKDKKAEKAEKTDKVAEKELSADKKEKHGKAEKKSKSEDKGKKSKDKLELMSPLRDLESLLESTLLQDLFESVNSVNASLEWLVSETKKAALGAKKSAMGPKIDTVHQGVYCDSCHADSGSTKSIVGYRYTCLCCDDFDLCESCFEKDAELGSHESSHIMARLKTSDYTKNSLSAEKLGWLARKQGSSVLINYTGLALNKSAVCANCVETIDGVWYKCFDCHNFTLCEKCYKFDCCYGSHRSDHDMRAIVAADKYYGKSETVNAETETKATAKSNSEAETLSGKSSMHADGQDLVIEADVDCDVGRRLHEVFQKDELAQMFAKMDFFDALTKNYEGTLEEKFEQMKNALVGPESEPESAEKSEPAAGENGKSEDISKKSDNSDKFETASEKAHSDGVLSAPAPPASAPTGDSTGSSLVLPTLLKESSIFLDAESSIENFVEVEKVVQKEEHNDIVSSVWDSDDEDSIREEYEVIDEFFE